MKQSPIFHPTSSPELGHVPPLSPYSSSVITFFDGESYFLLTDSISPSPWNIYLTPFPHPISYTISHFAPPSAVSALRMFPIFPSLAYREVSLFSKSTCEVLEKKQISRKFWAKKLSLFGRSINISEDVSCRGNYIVWHNLYQLIPSADRVSHAKLGKQLKSCPGK